MRFHVIWRKSHEPEEAYRDFFETNDIYEAKDFAMRLAFDETNLVCVRDEKRDEIVRDFDGGLPLKLINQPPPAILRPEVIFMPKRKRSREGFPYDATPDVHHFPGVPRSSFDLVNMYGTYNIQPTSDTENTFPLIAPGLPKAYRNMKLDKHDLEP